MNLTTLQLQTHPKIEGIWTHLRMDAPPTIDAEDNVDGDSDERATNKEGYTAFGYVPKGDAYVLVRGCARGFTDQLVGPIAMPHDDLVTVNMVRAPLPRLVSIDRHRFVTSDNWRVHLKGCTDFSLLWKLLKGEDITPVLRQRAAFGFTMVRVFGMMHYIPQNDFGLPAFRPQDFGDFDQGVVELHRQAHAEGLYVYFSAFPDAGLIMPRLDDQVRHHSRLTQLGLDLYELTNEGDAHSFNAVDVPHFRQPDGLLSCAGSAGEGLHPYYWDFFDFHPRRVYPAHVKDQNLQDNPNTQQGREGGLGENDRFGSNGNGNTVQAFETGGASLSTALFSVFHSTNGKRSELFDEQTADCARAYLAGYTA